MKKVGILTINDYNNYGNRLQNYAVQEVLKSLGCEVETVVNKTRYKNDYHNLSFMQKLMKNSPQKIVKKIVDRIKYNPARLKQVKSERVRNFENFTSAHIKETSFVITETSIPDDLAQNYDYFVTGSDQVWNPNYREGSFIDFLTFAPAYKRIAFSPSFGISQIPEEYVNAYTSWLSEMKSLSVREDAGAKIIKQLTGRDAPVLVDPTLMLTKDDWLKISKVPAMKPNKKYILTYFLGAVPVEIKSYIGKLAREHDMDIVNLVDLDNMDAYTAAPDEFIGYVDEASLICTNSFHSAVFAILFSRPFIVFERGVAGSVGTMNSRMDTLLGKFSLESRSASNVKSSGNIFDVSYDHIEVILEKERLKVRQYLSVALNSEANS